MFDDNEIRSAFSKDGETWVREDGVRFTGSRVVDPDVLITRDDQFRMYYSKNSSSVRSAISDDGLVFREEEGERVANGKVSCTLLLPTGGYRTFYHSTFDDKVAVFTALSDDGLFFREATPVITGDEGEADGWGAESPSAAPLPNGETILIYVSTVPGGPALDEDPTGHAPH